MTLEVNYNVYRRIVQFAKTSDKPIPILRFKPPRKVGVGDIVKIRSVQNTYKTKTLIAKVVEIKEYDGDKDGIPYDDLKPIYESYLKQIPKLPRVVIIYVNPINF